ncbi:MAG: TlpA disulfide reductase family protein [Spirochaetia bacterium]
MLGSRSFELGPFNIPLWLVAAVGGYLAAVLVQRLFLRRHKSLFVLANDLLTTAVVVALVIWKLTPLATRFAEIVNSPARLLYYPGGSVGLLAGAAGGVAATAFIFLRRRRLGDEAAASLVKLGLAVAVTAGFVLLPLTVVSLIPFSFQSSLPTAEVELLDPIEGADNLTVQLAGLSEGKPTVLVFWATWCGPCTAQMPEVQRFYEENGRSVRVLAVNLTTTERSEEAVAGYMNENGYTLPVLLDTQDALRSTLGVRATPTTVIFDSYGDERVRRTGAVTAAWIERRALPLLR